MAKDEGDVRGTKAARAEFAKRGIDLTLADMRCQHGVVYVRGTVRAFRGSAVTDIKAEMELIARVLRQRPDIKEVQLECVFRS